MRSRCERRIILPYYTYPRVLLWFILQVNDACVPKCPHQLEENRISPTSQAFSFRQRAGLQHGHFQLTYTVRRVFCDLRIICNLRHTASCVGSHPTPSRGNQRNFNNQLQQRWMRVSRTSGPERHSFELDGF